MALVDITSGGAGDLSAIASGSGHMDPFPQADEPAGDLMDWDNDIAKEDHDPARVADADTDAEAEAEADSDNELVGSTPDNGNVPRKRNADMAGFDLWLAENHKKLTDARKKGPAPGGNNRTAHHAPGSRAAAGFEGQKIITSPRDYQIELFERAKEQNTIAVLDTGSGKTLIAALLLRWTIEKEVENRANGLPKRISFFLVDKVSLVFQQHAVLDCNLDHPIDKFCGEMVDHLWSRELWEKAFSDNMAIVCTADILYKCLHHSFIHMDQINLLIFDEAHHAKKSHPYASIIKDFYARIEDKAQRPRILGMTASPVDSQADIQRAAAELEGLLQSRIVTASNPEDLQRAICKPKTELVLEYGRILPPQESDLCRSLRSLLGSHTLFRKPLAFAKYATTHLGPWCADRFWILSLAGRDRVKIEARTERSFLTEWLATDDIRKHLEQAREASEMVTKWESAPVAIDDRMLSSKVIKLVRALEDRFGARDETYRCIVFVDQRWTAMVLADLFQQPAISIPGLKPGVLVGANSPDASEDKVTFRDLVSTIKRFKKGELNCLFSTSVGEEGLDVPECNIIVRFDLYRTTIQYIQSRGRARHENSQYIHMIESGNAEHRRKILQSRDNEQALRRFCESMPEDRKLRGNDFDMDYFLRRERDQRQYTVPSTRARLNYKSSLSCLSDFVASLPHAAETALSADFLVTAVPGGFRCEVMLPSASPIRSALGRIHASKQVAKCAAAFEMCLRLIKGKFLDEYLQPCFAKQLPSMRNARLALNSGKPKEYKVRQKPSIWSSLGVPEELYATVLALSSPGSLGRPSRPLLLLTRQQITPVTRFPLFFGKDKSSHVDCVPLPRALPVDADVLDRLVDFTLAVFKDVFSKEYEATAADLPYFICPLALGHDFDHASARDGDPRDMIDWAVLRAAAVEASRVEYTGNETDDFFRDKFVTDPWDGSRKFFLRRRRGDLKPLDPVPETATPPAHRSWKTVPHNIWNYSISLWTRSRKAAAFREDQPVVEAEILPISRNFLDEVTSEDDPLPMTCFLILEPLRISSLPPDVVAMAYCFPSIIHRIEASLITQEICAILGLPIRPDLALEAFTRNKDNSDESDVDQDNNRGGAGNNYERLEFLGDTFLKMATTISIHILYPDKDEFESHVERMLLVCNKNLFANALKMNLHEYIRSVPFHRRTWYPEGLALKRGKRAKTPTTHALPDKAIADVCEAVIGAAYQTARSQDGSSGSSGSFDMAIRAVTTMVGSENHAMASWPDYYAAYTPPEWQTAKATPTQEDMAQRLAARLGYVFRHPRLLRCAFVHPSYPARSYEKIPSYQRLEFLGDALLDMVCVDHLFNRFPGADPQWLTEHKMSMVGNHFLGCLAVSLGFHKHLLIFDAGLQKDVLAYALEAADALAAARDSAAAAGRDPADHARDYWVRLPQPPKCLADSVEAYIGAIFVDSAFDLAVVRRFFDTHLLPYFADMAPYDSLVSRQPVTLLSRLIQLRFHCADWRLLVRDLNGGSGNDEPAKVASGNGGGGGDGSGSSDGNEAPSSVVCGLRIHGLTAAYAVSASGRYAKLAVAKQAVRELEGLSVSEFQQRFGCDCGKSAAESGEQAGDAEH